jgi:hypothetical protein
VGAGVNQAAAAGRQLAIADLDNVGFRSDNSIGFHGLLRRWLFFYILRNDTHFTGLILSLKRNIPYMNIRSFIFFYSN